MVKNSVKRTPNQNSKEGPETSNEDDHVGCVEMDVDNTKSTKKIWSLDALKEKMNPTCEELDYRTEKSFGLNPVEKFSKLFKCTKCQKNLKPSIEKNKKVPVHTSLGVLMCEQCRAYYEDGEFSVDSDGEEKYCRWCGEGGTIFTCSQCICGFCANCIKQHFSLKFYKQVQRDENWLCFFCDPKPLWFQRFICSLAVQFSEEADTFPLQAKTSPRLKANRQKQSQTSPTLNENEEKQSQTSPTVSENEQKQSQTSPTINENEQKQSQSSPTLSENEQSQQSQTSPTLNENEQSQQSQTSPTLNENEQKQSQTSLTSSENEQKNDVSAGNSRIKRKRVYTSSSSSDETDCEASKSPLKKYKLVSNPLKSLLKNMEEKSTKDDKTGVIFELQKLLKLSEYQMSFGVTWCHETSEKLSQSDRKLTEEGILDECKKIKWFLSVLSTYLVQFSNSVDSIERSLSKNDGQKISDTTEKHESTYTTILRFLDFVTNQVKTFAQKGISFSDILEASIHDDGKVIGLKRKTSLKSEKVDPVTTELDLTKEDSDGNDSKEENIQDDVTIDEINLEIESDHNNESSHLESGDSSTPRTTHMDNNTEGSNSKEEIQKLLSILENA